MPGITYSINVFFSFFFFLGGKLARPLVGSNSSFLSALNSYYWSAAIGRRLMSRRTRQRARFFYVGAFFGYVGCVYIDMVGAFDVCSQNISGLEWCPVLASALDQTASPRYVVEVYPWCVSQKNHHFVSCVTLRFYCPASSAMHHGE